MDIFSKIAAGEIPSYKCAENEEFYAFLDINPIVKGQYGEATNPIFEVFYLDNAHGVIADFSGNPPYEF